MKAHKVAYDTNVHSNLSLYASDGILEHREKLY